MEFQTQQPFGYAHNLTSEIWAAFNGPGSTRNQDFSLRHTLFTYAHVERYGQIAPPEERSPVEPRRNSVRESSIPVEQLRNEILWPEYLNSSRDYQRQYRQAQSAQQNSREPSPERHRTSRQPSANQNQANIAALQDANPQLQKHKRGVPRYQPQIVESFIADGLPSQCSSPPRSHLEKNRVVAHKCRQRKKEYIGGLEARAGKLFSKDAAIKENLVILRKEVLDLKYKIPCHARCGFWAVDAYDAQYAGDLLDIETPPLRLPVFSTQGQTQSLTMLTVQIARETSPGFIPDQRTTSSPDSNNLGGLGLLKDYAEDLDDLR